MDDLLDQFNSYPLGQKILVFLIIVVGLFAAFWFGFYYRLDSRYAELKEENGQLDAKRQKYESKLEDQVTKEDLQELRAKILLAEDKLPSTTQLPRLLKDIHNKAKTAGLEILNFQRKPEQKKKYYVEIPVAMELRGTYGELTSFLNFVRNMNRIVNVGDLKLELKSKKTGELVVSATATTYRYKEGTKTQKKDETGNP